MPNLKSEPLICIVNPNSTEGMTASMRSMLEVKGDFVGPVRFEVINPTTGPLSINNEEDAQESLRHCIDLFSQVPDLLTSCDAYLVACYSTHPLVEWLRSQETIKDSKPVLGIFEASVTSSLALLSSGKRYGIVSTGKVWETLLTDGVHLMAQSQGNARVADLFAGVETTGLDANELHEVTAEEVNGRMKQAVKRLLERGPIGAICLGCAGMVGLDDVVRTAVVEAQGKEEGESVAVIDGIVHGVSLLLRQLDGQVRA